MIGNLDYFNNFYLIQDQTLEQPDLDLQAQELPRSPGNDKKFVKVNIRGTQFLVVKSMI